MFYTWELEKLQEAANCLNKENLTIPLIEKHPQYVVVASHLKKCSFRKVRDCYGLVQKIFNVLEKKEFFTFISYMEYSEIINKRYVYRNRMRIADIDWKNVQEGIFSFKEKNQCEAIHLKLSKLERGYKLSLTYDPTGLAEVSGTVFQLTNIIEKYFKIDYLFADRLSLDKDPSHFVDGSIRNEQLSSFEKLVSSSIYCHCFSDEKTLPFRFRMNYLPSNGLKEDQHCTIDFPKQRAWIDFGDGLPRNFVDYLKNTNWQNWYQKLGNLGLVSVITTAPNAEEFMESQNLVFTWKLEKLQKEVGYLNKKNLTIRLTEKWPQYVILASHLKRCSFQKVEDCYDLIEQIFKELGKDKFDVFISYEEHGKEINKGYIYRNRTRLADVKWKDVQMGIFSFETKEEAPQCMKVHLKVCKSRGGYRLSLTYDPSGLMRVSETVLRLIDIIEKYFIIDCLFADMLFLSREPSDFIEGIMCYGQLNAFEKLVCSSINYHSFYDERILPFLFRMNYVVSDGLKEDRYCAITPKKKRAWIDFGERLPREWIDYLENEDWQKWYRELEKLGRVSLLTNASNIREFRG